MLTTQTLADALRYDGDTITDPDTELTFTFHVEPDHDTSLSDFDAYGEVSDYRRHSDQSNRPAHFTGAACKIDADRSGYVWWQPPADLPTDQTDSLRSLVRDIIEQGFQVFAIDVTEPLPSRHFPGLYRDAHVQSTAIGGIEPCPDDAYSQSIISDLAHEILLLIPAYN